MIVKNAKYELTAVKPEQYPGGDLPEVAFVGRSNVGKSSMINTLLNRKNLARVGATPGKTRQINFYNIDEKLYFVDLPGYGYASVSKTERKSWGEVIDTYLASRTQLKLIIMLIDIRHTPSEDDRTMFQWLEDVNIPYLLAATKTDKLSRSQVAARLGDIRSTFEGGEGIKLIPFSSEKKQGMEELWKEIDAALNF